MLGRKTVVDIQYGAPDTWAPIPVDPAATGWVEDTIAMLNTEQLDESGRAALSDSTIEMHGHLSQQACVALGIWVADPSVPLITGHVVLTRIIDSGGQELTPESYQGELGMRDLTEAGISESEITQERLRAAPAVKVSERIQAHTQEGGTQDTWRVIYALFPKRTNEAVQLQFTAPVSEALTETFLADAEAMAHSVEITTARA